MILTVLALGGAILGATTIAGLLMLYQIRQTTDLANSGKAVYAADAGIEWTLYNWFCANDPNKTNCPATDSQFTWNLHRANLSNGAKVQVTQYCFNNTSPNPIGNSDDGTCDVATIASSTTFKSMGVSGNSTRAFGLSF